MEPLLDKLSRKDRLDVTEASELLRFLQIETNSILSHSHSASPSTGGRGRAHSSSPKPSASVRSKTTSFNHRQKDLARNAVGENSSKIGETFIPRELGSNYEVHSTFATVPFRFFNAACWNMGMGPGIMHVKHKDWCIYEQLHMQY